jgi:hypothetical protein
MEATESSPPAQSLGDLDKPVLMEIIRQFRATRNDILRYGVWNIRNLSEDEFKQIDDDRLFDYFRQDLLETRFVDRGRRVDLVQVWHWFDDQLSGTEPLLLDGREVLLNIEDKDLEKLRKRIAEIREFLPVLAEDDRTAFRRIKYKLRRTVMRLTYDLHHANKRLEKYRKRFGIESPRGPAVEEEVHGS